MLDNIVKGFYNKPGTYSEDIDGIAVINTYDVEFRDSNINIDAINSEGVSNGKAYLNNVNIRWSLKVNSYRTDISRDSSNMDQLRIGGQDLFINTNGKTKIDNITRVYLIRM